MIQAMKDFNQRKNVFTIPNILSFFRILLIPLIFVAYFSYDNLYFLGAVIVLSGLTDVVDGFIARKFNMVSDLGKMLDPFADKLTQGSLILCLISKYDFMYVFIGFFVVFEVLKAVLGYVVSKKTGEMRSAKWFGKFTTVYLYETFFVLLIFKNLNPVIFYVKSSLGILFTVISSCMYCYSYLRVLIDLRKEKSGDEK